MNIKLLLTGLSIVFLNILVGNLAIMKIYFPYQSTMLLLLSVISLLLWFFLLRTGIPLKIKAIDVDMRKASALLFIIPVGIALYLLITSQTVNFNMIGYVFVTSLIVAIYEEILFRFITLGTFINAQMSPTKAIIASSIIFSVSHMIYNPITSWNILLLLNTFMMGVILGYIYYETSNIFFVITIHFIWDFTVFINQSLPSQEIGLVTTLILFSTTVLYFSWSYRKVLRISH